MSHPTLSFEGLRCHYNTAQSYHISGQGKHKVMGYRHGVMCNLGDIEQSEWKRLMHSLISLSGEDELYQMLFTWIQEKRTHSRRHDDVELDVLEAHAARLFDCEGWVDFIGFNQRFRPHVLKSVQLVLIQCECCKSPGYTTRALLNHSYTGTTPCPVCKRWAAYQIVDPSKEVHST